MLGLKEWITVEPTGGTSLVVQRLSLLASPGDTGLISGLGLPHVL